MQFASTNNQTSTLQSRHGAFHAMTQAYQRPVLTFSQPADTYAPVAEDPPKQMSFLTKLLLAGGVFLAFQFLKDKIKIPQALTRLLQYGEPETEKLDSNA